MTTNITKLKKQTKGSPPPADIAPDVIKTNSRNDVGSDKTAPLQLKIPESRLDEFDALARKVCGRKKGALSKFFIEMLDFYQENKKA